MRKRSAGKSGKASGWKRKTDNFVGLMAKKVGGDKLGMVLVDPHKNGSVLKMVDYYGVELYPPREYRNTAVDMRGMVADVEKAVEEQGLKEVVAGVEMTGRYHSLVKRTLRGRWKVRMIHPFATSRMRQPANPGEKTDPVDSWPPWSGRCGLDTVSRTRICLPSIGGCGMSPGRGRISSPCVQPRRTRCLSGWMS